MTESIDMGRFKRALTALELAATAAQPPHDFIREQYLILLLVYDEMSTETPGSRQKSRGEPAAPL